MKANFCICFLVFWILWPSASYGQNKNELNPVKEVPDFLINKDSDDDEPDYGKNIAEIPWEKSGFSFQSYKPTQLGYSFIRNHNTPDTGHFLIRLSPEFHWNLRYHNDSARWTIGIVYNCEYGFYLGTLYSGPVLSRLQNPFIYTEYKFGQIISDKDNSGTMHRFHKSRVGFTLAHESNGMFIDSPQVYQSMISAGEAGKQEYRFHNYNSMGWNYIGFTYRVKTLSYIPALHRVFNDPNGEFGIAFRMYFNQLFGYKANSIKYLENHIYVDTLKLDYITQQNIGNITIRNYDGARFYYWEEFPLAGYTNNNRERKSKMKLFYQLVTGKPIGGEWGVRRAYRITQTFELSYGWRGNNGAIYFVAGHQDGYREYLSNYPCFSSLWYFALQAGF